MNIGGNVCLKILGKTTLAALLARPHYHTRGCPEFAENHRSGSFLSLARRRKAGRGRSSFIPHPSSLVSHPSSLVSHPSSLVSHPSSLVSHLSSLISHPSSIIYHLSFILRGTPCGWQWPKWPKIDLFIKISPLFQSQRLVQQYPLELCHHQESSGKTGCSVPFVKVFYQLGLGPHFGGSGPNVLGTLRVRGLASLSASSLSLLLRCSSGLDGHWVSRGVACRNGTCRQPGMASARFSLPVGMVVQRRNRAIESHDIGNYPYS